MKKIIEGKELKYKIKVRNENNEVIRKKTILDDINIEIEKGEFIALLGPNGSGKSTLARHMNGLLIPDEGTMYIDGKSTADVDKLWEIRRNCGMVFQNPDNQIVGVTVEEDVGFGPENLGIETKKIWSIVDEALKKVDMRPFNKKSPNHLSGGQKQRVAIASSLAMKPECMVFDEPTAMLDPEGRRDIMELISYLNKRESMTVVLITHHMDEAIMADRIYLMNEGKIVDSGTRDVVFGNNRLLSEFNLEMPKISEFAIRLGEMGRYDVNKGIPFSMDEFLREFVKKNGKDDISFILENNSYRIKNCENNLEITKDINEQNTERIIRLENVSLIYEKDTEMESRALDSIDMDVHAGEIIGIVGHTGSGKSSLVQVMTGLIKPVEGNVLYRNENIFEKKYNRQKMHCNVGIVFQYPESQLFEETVLKDVMFGPLNKGLEKEIAEKKAREALDRMNISREMLGKSPFELSGGEKRRVAIAGILAMEPEILVLDEPTAGLDSKSRKELFNLLLEINAENNTTIIVVSHSMEDMADYVKRLVVMSEGRVLIDDDKRSVFDKKDLLEGIGLDVPIIKKVMIKLKEYGYEVDTSILNIGEALGGVRVNA